MISVDEIGKYVVTGRAANGCEAQSDSIEITENKVLPIIELTGDFAICKGANATITASGANTYVWSHAGANISQEASITVTPAVSTSYVVEGTITETGCKNSYTVDVNVEQPLILTLQIPDNNVDLGDEITLTVYAEGAAHDYYNWFINNVFYEQTTVGYLVIEPDAGRQLFRVETATAVLNCFAMSESSVINVEEFVPSAINPYNPGGNNCCFMMSNGQRSGYYVEIYNRYMQKVFEGKDGWDGTYRGAPAEPGTYFYRVHKKSGEVGKGTLEVVRF